MPTSFLWMTEWQCLWEWWTLGSSLSWEFCEKRTQVHLTILPGEPMFLYDYNFSRTKIRIKKKIPNSWIPLEAGIQFGPKHCKTMALCIIRMLNNIPQSQPWEGHIFLGVVSPRRVKDHSCVQCVWPIEEGNLDCHGSYHEPRSTWILSAGLIWKDN